MRYSTDHKIASGRGVPHPYPQFASSDLSGRIHQADGQLYLVLSLSYVPDLFRRILFIRTWNSPAISHCQGHEFLRMNKYVIISKVRTVGFLPPLVPILMTPHRLLWCHLLHRLPRQIWREGLFYSHPSMGFPIIDRRTHREDLCAIKCEASPGMSEVTINEIRTAAVTATYKLGKKEIIRDG